uniref:Putative G3BP-like protein isoform X3 n=1 Tax=Populus alba TaxID=43335 RepID=A0A4U5R282_POPAL|nr:putative G3BP-like protein isoform X3 [Populus alba]
MAPEEKILFRCFSKPQIRIQSNQMATQETAPASGPSAQVVGNAFVEQYYHILHESPELVHRFYQDSSSLSRPNTDGFMTTVTTMQAINDKILSLNYEDYTAEIKTADAQESHAKGVIVLVTGCLTGKDDVKKKFTQTFFLAPQEKGYFVLNDVFRFVGENEPMPNTSALANGIVENAPPALTAESDPTQVTDHLTVDPATSFEEEDLNNGSEVCDHSDKEDGSVIDVEVVEPVTDSTQNEILATINAAPASLEDAPKISYASILKVMKGNTPHPVHFSMTKMRAAPISIEQQSANSAKSAAPEALASAGSSAGETSDVHEEAEGHSIFVKNLPFDATVGQLEEAFKHFGPIKRGGIQVRSSKQGFCFGFVEFETMSSMQGALEASPINIGDHQAIVEEKRTNTRVGSSSGRGRYSSGRSGFRSDSFKSRGNFFGSRGHGRNEFKNQGEFSGRPRGSTGYAGEDHQQGNQSGSRRGGRQGGTKSSSFST